MIDEKVSSDEIKGLLGQKGTEENKVSKSSLSQMEKEALTELYSVSLGSSAAVLSSLFLEQVSMTTPALSIKHKESLLTDALSPFFIVLGEYAGETEGLQILSLSTQEVEAITGLANDEREAKDEEKQFQVMQELVQQMFAAVSQSMGTILDQELSYSISGMDVIDKQEDFPVNRFTSEEWFVEVQFDMKVGDAQSVHFHLYIPVSVAQQMTGILTGSMDEEDSEETQEMDNKPNNQSNNNNPSGNAGSSTNIQKVQFSNFDDTAAHQIEPNNLNMLFDIPLQVTVELGRTKRTVKEILEVSQGSIIELDKLAGEPVDILVNNKLIAVGEVVVIDENFGVRVTDILSAADRISKLR